MAFWGYGQGDNNEGKKGFMDSQLYDIAYLIQFKDQVNTKVSKVPIAWHLDHSLKVINKIHDVLKSSDPSVYEKRFSLARNFSYTFGYIPRGIGKSPGSVLPPNDIKTEDILSQLEIARENLLDLESLDENVNFIHPVFGQLNKKQAKRFLKIHTRHHLKIIQDILRKE
ncbi:DUF1569 domain-containing protein [Aquimarina sp. BL5]|uniref:DUF1569 domain-containing protein n=1 Tax=Aquimarina sp. BL5 TaxID=1714860 RepID=UPI000E540878|nr:DUF1569 domain-containing protein [Aquimarina sp. BL5]AXT50755.1 DUF1569 domain-containing protein [Aquimarina sp. BL5]RKN08222.1 DUF1569 domain-containing protein [Aquimarina sp. BL5]